MSPKLVQKHMLPGLASLHLFWNCAVSGSTLKSPYNYLVGTIFRKTPRIETYLKNARVAQADTSLSQAALEHAKIRQVAQAWAS